VPAGEDFEGSLEPRGIHVGEIAEASEVYRENGNALRSGQVHGLQGCPVSASGKQQVDPIQ
jgi:hypothetical protein